MASKCQPRVFAAFLRLLCNGWCTKARFQVKGCCRLGCGAPEDSVQHLARCRVVRGLFWQHLRIPAAEAGAELDAFLGLKREGDVNAIRRRALATYALYRTYNSVRAGSLQLHNLQGAFAEYLSQARRCVE